MPNAKHWIYKVTANINKIVLASGNAGKVREINKLFSSSGIEVIPQSDFNVTEVPETGTTFVENAIIKARHAAEQTGLPAISDDSGIEVDALDARPGVYSARYAGKNANDTDNNNKMLEELKGIPEAERTARYWCLLVFMRSHTDPVPIITQGSWEGRILEAPRGNGGFGYDPLFYVPTHQCSGGELPLDVKNTISHRAIALQAMLVEFRKHNFIN
jgi:XTP/dITP diphosphohydrolase